jgi:hypothetical protein
MAELSIQPVEVLSTIIDSLTAFEVGKLWLCGDSRLSSRLKNGGVRKFEIDWRTNCKKPFWPGMLSEFLHLDILCIKSSRPIDEKMMLAQAGSLSRTLKQIHIATGAAIRFFTSLNLMEHFSQLKSFVVISIDVYTLHNLNKLPDHLQALDITFSGSAIKDICTTLSRLPLTHLRLYMINIATPDHVLLISKLNGLLKLSIETSFHELKFDACPPNLTHFQCETILGPEHLERFPIGLTKLEVYIRIPLSDIIPKLPKSITSLSLNSLLLERGVSVATMSQLPRQLRTLEISSIRLPMACAAFLPKTLTRLQCKFSSEYETRNAAIANESQNDAEIEHDIRSMTLPYSLISLEIGVEDVHDLPRLPPSVEYFVWSHNLSWRACVFEWPKNIEYLAISLFDQKTSWSDPSAAFNTEAMLEARKKNDGMTNSLLLMPRSLSQLKLTLVNPTPLHTILPEAGLLTLRLDCQSSQAPAPVNSGNLSIFMEDDEGGYGDGEEEVEVVDVFMRMFPSAWSQLLPTTLTSLFLDVPSACLDEIMIQHLNLPGLKSLSFSTPVLFHSKYIDTLPHGLEQLTVQFKQDIFWNSFDLRKKKALNLLSIYTADTQRHHDFNPANLLSSILPPNIQYFHTNAPIPQSVKSALIDANILVICATVAD